MHLQREELTGKINLQHRRPHQSHHQSHTVCRHPQDRRWGCCRRRRFLISYSSSPTLVPFALLSACDTKGNVPYFPMCCVLSDRIDCPDENCSCHLKCDLQPSDTANWNTGVEFGTFFSHKDYATSTKDEWCFVLEMALQLCFLMFYGRAEQRRSRVLRIVSVWLCLPVPEG